METKDERYSTGNGGNRNGVKFNCKGQVMEKMGMETHSTFLINTAKTNVCTFLTEN